VRIGLILDAYKPVINGITNFVALYKRRLEDAGHEPVLFTWNARGYVDDEPGIERLGAVPLGRTGYACGGATPPCSGSAAVARRGARASSIPGRAHGAALRPAARHSHRVHQSRATTPPRSRRCRPRWPTVVGAYLAAFARCDAVVAPSRGLAEVLAELGVRRSRSSPTA
jgi:hypothetical protein